MNPLTIAAFVGAAVLLVCVAGGVVSARLIRNQSIEPSQEAPAFQATAAGLAMPLQQLLRQAGLRQSVGQLYVALLLVAAVGFAVAWLLHLPWMYCGLAALAAAAAVPVLLKVKKVQRQQQFVEQLPSGLELMANALRAGLGINSAMGLTAQEIPEPLGSEFSQLVAELNLGGGLETSLEHLVQRNPSNDVRLLAQAITIHKQVGGNLAEVLDNLDKTIRERFYLQRELKSMTIEQQLSAWVLGLLPAAMGIVIAILNPAYMSVLTKTKDGHFVLLVAVMLQIIGAIWLRAILKVDF